MPLSCGWALGVLCPLEPCPAYTRVGGHCTLTPNLTLSWHVIEHGSYACLVSFPRVNGQVPREAKPRGWSYQCPRSWVTVLSQPHCPACPRLQEGLSRAELAYPNCPTNLRLRPERAESQGIRRVRLSQWDQSPRGM